MLDRDAEGFFLNRACAAHLREPWAEIVAQALAAIQSCFDADLHSVYVRGSVADGSAIPGVADVDLVAVLHRDTTAADRVWRDEEEGRNRTHVGDVEIDLVALRHLLDGDAGALWQFALSTQGLCIFGADVIPDLPRFRPTRDLAIRLVAGMRRHINGALARLEDAVNPAVVQRGCKRSAKYLLRAAAALVLEREGYSRDLRECAALFLRHYPALAPATQDALRLAVTPSGDPTESRALLVGFGAWISEEVDRVLQPHEPAR